MPVHNPDIAAMFEDIADLLELQGANPFRIRAYRNAARTVGRMSDEAAGMLVLRPAADFRRQGTGAEPVECCRRISRQGRQRLKVPMIPT